MKKLLGLILMLFVLLLATSCNPDITPEDPDNSQNETPNGNDQSGSIPNDIIGGWGSTGDNSDTNDKGDDKDNTNNESSNNVESNGGNTGSGETGDVSGGNSNVNPGVGDSENNSGDGNNQDTTHPEEDAEMAIFNALFDETTHVSFHLKISDSELMKIQQDYDKYCSFGSKSPIYRMADLVITLVTKDGQTGTWTIPQVGVRMKGNTSRTSFYDSHNGMYNLVHFKISFQETFDDEEYYGKDALNWTDSAERKARKNRTFATL